MVFEITKRKMVKDFVGQLAVAVRIPHKEDLCLQETVAQPAQSASASPCCTTRWWILASPASSPSIVTGMQSLEVVNVVRNCLLFSSGRWLRFAAKQAYSGCRACSGLLIRTGLLTSWELRFICVERRAIISPQREPDSYLSITQMDHAFRKDKRSGTSVWHCLADDLRFSAKRAEWTHQPARPVEPGAAHAKALN
jgi:hypothetical protein